MRFQGRLTQWNDSRGFGFITPNGGGGRVFVHANSFRGGGRRPAEGELLTYELGVDSRGRPKADDIDFVGRPRQAASPRRSSDSKAAPLAAVVFSAILIGATFKGFAPRALLGLYGGASVLAFLLYWLDKRAAQSDAWRIQESTLHLSALAGGWPGAVLAQQLFRHKTRKESFRAVFWMTVVLNCAAIGWLLVAPGAATLRAGLGIGLG